MTIQAKIIADSINNRGTRITTFELEYPRIVHSEMLTHRVFSRNAASSRAIPVNTMLDLIEANPAVPSHWGKNQPGMQASEELNELDKKAVKELWLSACKQAVSHARVMNDIKTHKQVVNRITEPYQHMKVVLTATDYANWFYLRDHDQADPTIAELAAKMRVVFDQSKPVLLQANQWHLPYVQCSYDANGTQRYWNDEVAEITLEMALMVSVSCCAQVSYRKTDDSLAKAKMIYDKLIESKPAHSSPCEHQAKCLYSVGSNSVEYWPEGITQMDRKGILYSGNLRDWVQYRQLIPDNVKQEGGNE